MIELIVMIVSAVGLVVTGFVWIVVTAIGDRGGGGTPSIRPSDEGDRDKS